jgi:hypothetical protein
VTGFSDATGDDPSWTFEDHLHREVKSVVQLVRELEQSLGLV